MKTKINLTLLTALFASFSLVSCEQLPDSFDNDWEIESSNAKYTITFDSSTRDQGYVRAYVKDGDGNQSGINRANAGDIVWIRAKAYQGYEFMEWVATNVTLSEPESDEISFVMPASDVSFEVYYDNLSLPKPTPYDLITKIGYKRNDANTAWVKVTDAENSDRDKPENVALRAWKAQQKKQVFVWFDAWSGRKDVGANSMRGLPKEVSIIANWGQPKWDLGDWHKADMQYVREVYGAKIVTTLFSAKVGEDVPEHADYNTIGTSSDYNVIRPVIARYAKAIYDLVIACEYDGFDWDYEPTAGGRETVVAPLWKVKEQAACFLEELSYYFGTEAQDQARDRNANGIDRGTAPSKRLLLLVDGQVHDEQFTRLSEITEATTYVDYYVQQAYGATSIGACQNRLKGIVGALQPNIDKSVITKAEVMGRAILTENFEDPLLRGNGGGVVESMPTVQYDGLDTGGFGAYRVGLSYTSTQEEYRGSKFYTFLRKGIDAQYGDGVREPSVR